MCRSLLGHKIRMWDRMREMLWEVPHEPATSAQPGETLPLRTPALGKALLTEVVAHKPHGLTCVRNNEIQMWLKMLTRSKMQKHWQPYPEGVAKSCVLCGTAGPRGEWTHQFLPVLAAPVPTLGLSNLSRALLCPVVQRLGSW